MSYLKIKYFPINFSFYIYFILSNLFFALIFTLNVFWITAEGKKENKDTKILLIIPKIFNDFEEKRDLIFNQLSLNDDIISIDIENSQIVKSLLANIFKDIDLDEDLIPEVYKISVKNKKKLDLQDINIKISTIINSARVFSNHNESTFY